MNRPIYIFVTPFFPSPGRWKYGYGYDFVRALVDTGKYDVRVFMPYAHGGRDHGGALTDEDYEIKGVHVYRFPTKVLPSNVFPFLFARYNKNSFLKAIERAGIRLEDVVVCHGHTANFAIYPLAVNRKNPQCLTLLHHHDLQSFGLGIGMLQTCWLYNMMAFPILRHYHEQMDCHVFCSDLARKSFLAAPDTRWTSFASYKRQMRGLPYRPVHIKRSLVLHNGVDTTIFRPLSRPRPRPSTSTSFAIGCIGNFIECKDQITLIRACGILAKEGVPVKCIFIGSDILLDACKKEADSIVNLNLQPQPQFEFRTELPHDQLPDFYRSIDLFVLPSYFEGFGCVYPESWCCGTPFVACKGSAVEELVADDEWDKWLCNERDPTDLARVVKRYYEARGEQHLKCNVAIKPLVDEFVEAIWSE